MAQPVSVIIPLAPGETEWKMLVSQLSLHPKSEIILACGEWQPQISTEKVKVVKSASGRAQQMNASARAAVNSVLWFLHADSQLSDHAYEKLQACLEQNSDALYFFDLRFSDDGPTTMKLNEWAVRLRAGLLKMPFGDQGFCMSKDLFFRLGGYREDAAYGEDHLLVWRARQEGYDVKRVGADIFTSARKYHEKGWANITSLHVWLTLKQALPQFLILLKCRLRGNAE